MPIATVVKCSYINDVSLGGIWSTAWEARGNEVWKMKVLLYVKKWLQSLPAVTFPEDRKMLDWTAFFKYLQKNNTFSLWSESGMEISIKRSIEGRE